MTIFFACLSPENEDFFLFLIFLYTPYNLTQPGKARMLIKEKKLLGDRMWFVDRNLLDPVERVDRTTFNKFGIENVNLRSTFDSTIYVQNGINTISSPRQIRVKQQGNLRTLVLKL